MKKVYICLRKIIKKIGNGKKKKKNRLKRKNFLFVFWQVKRVK